MAEDQGASVSRFDGEPTRPAVFARRLDPIVRQRLDALLELDRRDNVRPLDPETTVLHRLRTDAGGPGLASIEEESAKVARLRSLGLPNNLFANISPSVLRGYRQRAAVEEPFELRRHPEALRMTLLAAFALLRGREIVDALVDLLIQTVHRIGARAERKVEEELLTDLRRVTGKHELLFQLADAALTTPDGIVKDVVIHYGNAGEFATNDREDQETEMLCLLVYINTLMIQNVLADSTWINRMTADDFRGLTPLVYGHVTPYGSFHLDMSRRLQLDGAQLAAPPTAKEDVDLI